LPALVLRSGQGKGRGTPRPCADARRAQHLPQGLALGLRFQPEQQKDIAAIVWLYRGQQGRFLKLVETYLAQAVAEGEAAKAPLEAFEEALVKLTGLIAPFAKTKRKDDPLAGPWDELSSAQAIVMADIEIFTAEAAARAKGKAGAARDNAGLNAVRAALHPLSECCRDLTKQIDLAAKLAGRVIDISTKELEARDSAKWANADIGRARKALDEARANAVEALRRVRYFVRQADWLQERFPDATLRDVEGLLKLVDHAAIEAHNWSLKPGDYVGVAPEEQDEDFDFEETLRSIHIDLKGLNEEAVELAARIARNFEELGA
jgi:type I restriction enzyme M protein